MAHPADDHVFRQERLAIERALERYVPRPSGLAAPLNRAIRYVLFPGGKRIRPVLALRACDALGGRQADVLPAACALELIHNYSLVHDDLPAMDDDDLRRGRPSCHKKFGEAMAILVGDAMQALAYEVIAGHTPNGSRVAGLTHELSRASGIQGMVGGQVLDMDPRPSLLRQIHLRKTGALFAAAARMGALAAGASSPDVNSMTAYGRAVGLVFQIVDDILDVSSTAQRLGKTPGKDKKQGKITYPSVFGLDRSRSMAMQYGRRARALVRPRWRRPETLIDFVDYILGQIA